MEIALNNGCFRYTAAAVAGNIIQNFSARFFPSQITSIVGPSGCGKTTLLNLIAGLLTLDSGSIDWPFSERKVGFVFQQPTLLPWLTVRENALFGAKLFAHDTPKVEEHCSALLNMYGLAGYENAFPSSLSGGMQQRASMIRAVLSGTKVMLLDEPFSNTDFVMRRELQKELSRLVADERLIAILVTHDIEEAVRIGDKVIVLSERPARVKAEIKIPIPREDRIKGSATVMQEVALYVERVERAFVSEAVPTKSPPSDKEVV
jgi:NitT/TauT family transport system ATP-binding protein